MQPPSHIKSKRQLKIWEKQHRENAEKRSKQEDYKNTSAFRCAERIYKSRFLTTEKQQQIIDISRLKDTENIKEVQLKENLRSDSRFGEEDDTWAKRKYQAYVIKDIPGLIVIPNPFTPAAQRQLVKDCLSTYAKPPHLSSLHDQYSIPSEGLWPSYEQEENGSMGERYSDIFKSHNSSYLLPAQLIKRQRWITLGYQYHWGTKQYDLDHPISIPPDIASMMKKIAMAIEDIGCEDASIPWINKYKGKEFLPEAGIINYYQLQSTLMGHVDKSELNEEAPLISISLGHSCIYLIGGETKDTQPIPLQLNSGDIIIMTAVAKKYYHGVPRILENTLPEYMMTTHSYEDCPDWALYGKYMETSRINLNIRQVFRNHNT
ncbi:hypothetical protein BDB01DRAFT_808318 [Pilobolus umbonatus]|nr:hypothetical protein BDB01DRAFT_808318 [Pilobolus umbonatus]